MKLIFAIVNNTDADTFVRNLSQNDFPCTRLSVATDGVSMRGDAVLLVRTRNDQAQDAIDLLHEISHNRKQTGSQFFGVAPGEGTLFVVDAERFELL